MTTETTPCSEKKWYLCFSVNFSQFLDKFYEIFSEYRQVKVSTDGNLILTKSVKYSLCIYAIITFFVKIITETFSEEGKHLIQFYRKTRHLGARRIIKLFPEKKWTLSWMQLITRYGDHAGQGLCSQDYQCWRISSSASLMNETRLTSSWLTVP